MFITSAFEGGNIEVVGLDGNRAQLKIEPDADPDYKQWFYFRCVAEAGEETHYSIVNAGECSFKDAWKDCYIVASYNREDWFRLATRYDGESLDFSLLHEYPSVYFAPFAPYPQDRHERMLAKWQQSPNVKFSVYGETLEKRTLDMITVGTEGKGHKAFWIVANQHPGEPMAQWCAEGIVERLLDTHDAVARSFLRRTVFYIVPNANPDGSYHGYIRTNAAGVDLNRAWQSATPEKSPEVYFLKKVIEEKGVDAFIDIHGDETIPHVFIADSDGVPSMTPERIALRERFEEILAQVNPDFEPGHGYERDKPGEADLNIGSKYIAEKYECFSFTLEQPFRDDKDNEDGYRGWSPERSQRLGASLLTALHEIF